MGQQAEVITGAGGGMSWDWAGWRGLVWTREYEGVCGCQSWKQLFINLEEMNVKTTVLAERLRRSLVISGLIEVISDSNLI